MNLIQDWKSVLTEIAEGIQIHSEGWISHADYPRSEPTAELIEIFQQLPTELQAQFLKSELARFLYDLYFSGVLSQSVEKSLTNTTTSGVNMQFFEKLHQSNSGTGYFDPDWKFCLREQDGSYKVQKSGLTLHIRPEINLAVAQQSVSVGDSLAILLPKNLIDQDHYIAIGNLGAANHQIIQYFFSFTSEVATLVMSEITTHLNDMPIPFTLKMLYNPEEYYRYDASVLSISKDHHSMVQPFLQTIYSRYQSSFHDRIPLFTTQLAPGFAVSDWDGSEGNGEPNFGVYCCNRLAEGILAGRSVEERIAEITQRFKDTEMLPLMTY